jgi:hypothetical protein
MRLRNVGFFQANYPFLTPQTKKAEFKKQNAEVAKNRGVKNG